MRFIASMVAAAIVLLPLSPTLAKAPQAASAVDINHASKSELMALPGITPAQAAQIIVARPYGSKSHLTTRGIVPRAVYERLKHRIVAKQDPATIQQLMQP